MSDPALIYWREALERLDAFLDAHAGEPPSLSVEVIARDNESWDFSLNSLRDLAMAARAGVFNAEQGHGIQKEREA